MTLVLTPGCHGQTEKGGVVGPLRWAAGYEGWRLESDDGGYWRANGEALSPVHGPIIAIARPLGPDMPQGSRWKLVGWEDGDTDDIGTVFNIDEDFAVPDYGHRAVAFRVSTHHAPGARPLFIAIASDAGTDWPQGFFPIGGDNRLRNCASEGCFQHVSIRVERSGVGSDHCEPCARKIAELLRTEEHNSDGTCRQCGSAPINTDGYCATCVDEILTLRPETASEHIARDMAEGRFPEQSERQMVPSPPAPAAEWAAVRKWLAAQNDPAVAQAVAVIDGVVGDG
jgi:hypothetical protein